MANLADFEINGIYDSDENKIVPENAGTWDDVSSWDNFTSWTSDPVETLIWITEPLDLENSQVFNLEIETAAAGIVRYSVFTSETGAFEGEETETEIEQDQTGIPSFFGRYVIVVVKVDKDGGSNELFNVSLRANNRAIMLRFSDLDTSTLPGTVDSRVLETERVIAGIENMQITPKTVPEYDLDVYVTDTPTCALLIPRIIDKTQLTFALLGLDNQPRDGVVDIIVETLPEQYMEGNNLRSR